MQGRFVPPVLAHLLRRLRRHRHHGRNETARAGATIISYLRRSVGREARGAARLTDRAPPPAAKGGGLSDPAWAWMPRRERLSEHHIEGARCETHGRQERWTEEGRPAKAALVPPETGDP